MEEEYKSENIIICMICREEEPEFLTWCGHNFHEACLKEWNRRIINECPCCRSFIISEDIESEPNKSHLLQLASENGYFDYDFITFG